ncbi:hypothetical protein Nepgr_030153 [Nepenthes gracilis]|uniref:Uncharacterized protein n=1 Tax=Nepenthes gracilis TaxID=150966 RepID=A0AAD3TE16_NEPGR|nr:hypothetical protein Nepgr_030153 [Nepenthes gracilis]
MALGVRDIASTMTLDRLAEIRARYRTPESTTIMIPESYDRAWCPQDGFITVYEIYLKGGLRFLLAEELYDIMRALGVPFARLQPNIVRYLVSLCVFFRCQKKLLNTLMVKGKVASQYSSDPSKEDREGVKKFTDLVLVNLGSFHLNKRNIWLSPEKFEEAKWGPRAEASAATPSEKSKKKRPRRRAGTLRIGSPIDRSEKNLLSESSECPAVVVELPSSDDDGGDLNASDLSNDDVIVPLLKRLRTGILFESSGTEGLAFTSTANPLAESSGTEGLAFTSTANPVTGSSGVIVQIVEFPDVESPSDDFVPEVPVDLPGDVSDRIVHPSEDIGGGNSAVDAERGVTTEMVRKVVEAEELGVGDVMLFGAFYSCGAFS